MTHTVWPTVATTSPCRGVGIGGDEIHSPSVMSDFSTVPRSRRRCPPVPPRPLKREGQQGPNGGSGALGVDAAIDDPDTPLQVTVDRYRRAGECLGGARPSHRCSAGGWANYRPWVGCWARRSTGLVRTRRNHEL